MSTIVLAPRGTRAPRPPRVAAWPPTLFDLEAAAEDTTRWAIADRAWALKNTTLGIDALFPQGGAGLRALWRAARGDEEVRAYLLEATWAGKWAAMTAAEGEGVEEAC